MDFTKLLILSILCVCCFAFSSALECYVCTNQEDNVEKCLNTIKTCEQGEDVCLSEIKWGSTPYWSQGTLKQFYISKRCATKDHCVKTRQRNMQYCTHIWYEDWACSECCQGDRCNFYIISGSTSTTRSTVLLAVGTLLSILVGKFL